MYEFEISKVKSTEINFVSNETIETTSSYLREWFQLPCQGGQREQCGWWSAKSYCKALNSGSSYWQDVWIEKKKQQDIKKLDGEMMMVIIIVVLVKNAKFWKNRNRKVNRGKYLEAKRKAKRAAYQVKYEA